MTTESDSGSVLFISRGTVVWGAEHSLLTLAVSLRRSGVTTGLVSAEGDLASAWRQKDLGEVFVVDQLASDGRIAASTALALHLPRILRRRRRQVWRAVVLFSYDLLPGLAAIRIAPFGYRARRPTLIWDCHDVLAGRMSRYALALCLPLIDGTISVSTYAATANRIDADVLSRPVYDRWSPSLEETQNSGLRVGIVGRVDPDKNIELLVEAAAALPDCVEIVVRGAPAFGDETYSRDLVQMGELLIGRRFTFEGATSQEDAMRNLDVLVVANASEPLGRTVIEAQLAGVVVVVPDRGGAFELVKPRITGLCYTADDASSLAAVLHEILDDPRLRSELRHRGRQSAVETSDPDRYAAAYVDAIVAARGNGRVHEDR